MRRIVSSTLLVLLLTLMFMLAFNVRLVHAQVETVTSMVMETIKCLL